MSARQRDNSGRELQKRVPVFAALGDETRLRLLARLSSQAPSSITHLTEDLPLTRQAITKHLRVLERAGLVRSKRAGRETLFELRPDTLDDAFRFLAQVSREWDEALLRLKSFVEE